MNQRTTKEYNTMRTFKKNVAKAILGTLAAAAAIITVSSPVSAHAGIQLYGATPTAGGYGAFFVRIPHGCEKLATDTVEVSIPAGFSSVRPQLVAGWNAETIRDAAGVVTAVKWSGGSLPDSQFADFGVNVKYPSTAGKYPIPVIQYCGSKTAAWIEVAAEGQDSHSLAKPAPVLTVAAKADGHGHSAATVGDVSAEIMSKHGHEGHLMVIADLPSTWRGKTVAVRADGKLIKRVKLDKAGDFELMTDSVKKGPKGWMVMDGSKIEIFHKGELVNAATIGTSADHGGHGSH
jgi:uncharacterized protein YcnI